MRYEDDYNNPKHTYYHTCKLCGANLDPGESCDCQKIIHESTDRLPKSPLPNETKHRHDAYEDRI